MILIYWYPQNVGIFEYEVFQPAFADSKLTIETLEQGMKYVQSRTLTFQKQIVLFAWLKALSNEENVFYFILKAYFVLKIFKFLSRLFSYVGKMAWLER